MIINNYMIDGRTKYDYVKSDVWLRDESLCEIAKKTIGKDIKPQTHTEVTKEEADLLWKSLQKEEDLQGIYGDDFLNNW